MRSFSGIIELDEQKEVLKSIGRFNLDWTDKYLTWDPVLEAITHDGTHVKYNDTGYTVGGRPLFSIQLVSISIIISS